MRSLRPGLRLARLGGAWLSLGMFAAETRAQSSAPYLWSTLAGSAGGNPALVNGTGSAARFYWPFGVAVDGTGNVFVADSYNNAVRKVTPAGVVTTATGTSASLNKPEGIAVDSAGNLYVADTFNQTIRKITPAGVVTTVAGQPGVAGFADGFGTAARFNFPRGLVLDAAGNLYVADSLNHIIRKVDATGAVSTFAGLATTAGSNDGTNGSARFNQPWGLAIDSTGNLFVTDYSNATIRRITAAGVVTTLAGLAPSVNVVNTGSADGTGTVARFFQPGGIAVDAAGNLFVADTFNQTIRKITSAGVVTTIGGKAGQSGSLDGLAGVATFSSPYGIAVDANGTLYVADQANSTIRAGGVPKAPVISLQPQNVTVTAGIGATFGVVASAEPSMTYQWQFNGAPLSGATSPTFSIGATQARDAGNYSVVVTSVGGTTTSTAATLTVNAPPAIVTAPQATEISANGPAQLSVGAAGSGTFTYQWQRDGVPVTGATSPTLTTDLAGAYTVVVTNAFGSTTSAPVRVDFPNRLVNLSTRGTVGSGANALVAGFVVTGASGTTKSLLIRGIGPALAAFGVEGAVAQTAILVADARGATVAANQGWFTNSNLKQLVDTTSAAGAFALPSNSGDSAVLINVAPGPYTVNVSSAGAAGTGLVEIYEVGADNTRLVNVSTRGQVSATNGLTAGVVVQGTAAVRLLVRAIGPALTQFGVANALARTQLTVINGGTTPLASNTSWGTATNAAEISAVAGTAGAFPLAAGSNDSALVLTLAPGNYTAQVTGVGGTSGAAMIEIYQLP